MLASCHSSAYVSDAAAAINGRTSAAPTINSARDRLRIRTRLRIIRIANAHQQKSATFGDVGTLFGLAIVNASQPSWPASQHPAATDHSVQ